MNDTLTPVTKEEAQTTDEIREELLKLLSEMSTEYITNNL